MAKKGIEGIVLNKDEGIVKVRIFRNNTCENCDCVLQDACDPDTPPQGRRGMFDIFADRSTLEFVARNTAQANVGDRIVVKIKNDKDLVEGSFLVYLLPGMLFLLGLFAGGWLATDVWGATGDSVILAQLAGGVVALVFSFVFAKLQMLIKGTERYVPEVTAILRRAEPPDRVIHSAPAS